MRKREMSPLCGIYKIISPTGRIYIGKSVSICQRFESYKLLFCKSQPLLLRSIKKYGWESHQKEVVELCSEGELNDREKYWINYFNSNGKNGMNCTLGGEGSFGRIWTEEQRKRQSERLKGVMSGEKNPFFGKKHSEESKRKVGDKNRARILSEEEKKQKTGFLLEYQKNNPHPSVGIKQSDDHIRNRVQKNTGKKRSEETKQLISQKLIGNKSWTGRTHTDEERKKMSIAISAALKRKKLLNHENEMSHE